MAINNFKQFNPNKINLMEDTTYETSIENGITTGVIADSKMHNKLFYQLSTFTKAFTDFMNKYNIDASDEDITQLGNLIDQAIESKVIDLLTPTTSGGGVQQY